MSAPPDGTSEPTQTVRDATRQLVLDLGRAPSFDVADFLDSPSNAEAAAMLARWPDWPYRTQLLVGPSGCGKSHLGAIWTARSDARIVRPGDALDPVAWAAPVVAFIEDCDRAGHEETALFHMLNRANEDDGWLLISARTPPSTWDLCTRDLVSRLRLAPILEIGPPDPMLMQAVIVKLFTDRQIRIDADVVAYAARHCERSLKAINDFVAAVDAQSLAAGRRITRPLAASAIAALGLDKSDRGD